MRVFVVGTAALRGGSPSSSSSDQSSTSPAGDFASLTVALGVGLGVSVGVIVILVVVIVQLVRRLDAVQRKNPAADDTQHQRHSVINSITGGLTPATHVTAGGSSSCSFDSIRSKFSVASEDSVDVQS